MTKNKHTRQIPIENVIDSTAEKITIPLKKTTELLHVLSGMGKPEAIKLLEDALKYIKQ